MRQKKVLFIHGGVLERGGTENYMMNVLRNIDRTRFQLDFLVFGRNPGIYDEEVARYGSKIYRIPYRLTDLKYPGPSLIGLFKSIQDASYDIVHAHMNALNGFMLGVMKRIGIKVRISHCHSSMHLAEGWFAVKVQDHFKKRIPIVATHLLACSKEAGHFLYQDHPFKIVYNGINLEAFAYNPDIRSQMRQDLNLESRFVVGHIGRFSHEKNHSFLIDVFKELKTCNPDAVLVLVGDGHLKQEIQTKVIDLGLTHDVIFTGTLTTASPMLQAFDIFVLPSLFEGLPYVLVEAQCAGLYSVCSNGISQETNITDALTYLPLEDPRRWAQELINKSTWPRHSCQKELAEKGYEIKHNVAWLMELYAKIMKENHNG